MKNLYIVIIIIGIIAEMVLLIFFDKQVAAYGPVIFWGISFVGILNYIMNIFKLCNSVKKTKPDLYKRHSSGIWISRNAQWDKEFLDELDNHELKIIENNKIIFKFLFLCFGLFAISAILIVLK